MPIMDESDVSLPKATLSKMIRELMPSDLRCGSDSLDMLIECCTEFVNLLSAESNEVSTREKKNTIHAEHVLKALEELGFGDFVPEVREAWASWKAENKSKTAALRMKGHKTAADAAGYSEEQQIEMQQKLFADARARSNSYQEPPPSSHPVEERPVEGMSAESLAWLSQFPSPAMPSECGSTAPSTPSAMYAELVARSDVLPIHPLPLSPIASEFKPNVIGSTPRSAELCENETPAPAADAAVPQQILDFRHISLSQPVIILHNGVQHLVSWQTVLSQVAMLPQFSQPPAAGPGEFPFQMPVSSAQAPVMQPSFPEPPSLAALTQSVALSVQGSVPSTAPAAMDIIQSEGLLGPARDPSQGSA